jgi:hypothetical protein
MEPEVHVRPVRRRRKPSTKPNPPHLNLRNLIIYAVVTGGIAALMLEGYLSHRPTSLLPALSQAIEIRSAISQRGESLQVVVSWDLTLSDPTGKPDSVRVRVLPSPPSDSLTSYQAAHHVSDTLYLAAPAVGQTLTGESCVAAQHPREPDLESCTPWQYVRPAVASTSETAVLTGIIVQPIGLQVDPDVGGRCAQWQASHPGQSVWISVNKRAVPECTGPNARPTVAQFCAFAVLPDGRRVKTANSINNPYCDELFEEWIRELYS